VICLKAAKTSFDSVDQVKARRTDVVRAGSLVHNAVVAWNMVHIEPVVEQLRAEGQRCDDELLSLTTPLLRRHGRCDSNFRIE
jgi:hypothetical protein